jgi:hypothetical protein
VLQVTAAALLLAQIPVVNFINILRAAFVQILFCQKIQSKTVIREKLQKISSVQKNVDEINT